MIKIDMEMPKCCVLCNFFWTLEKEDYEKYNFAHNDSISFRCIADNRLRRIANADDLKHRYKDCPLRGVKNDSRRSKRIC